MTRRIFGRWRDERRYRELSRAWNEEVLKSGCVMISARDIPENTDYNTHRSYFERWIKENDHMQHPHGDKTVAYWPDWFLPSEEQEESRNAFFEMFLVPQELSMLQEYIKKKYRIKSDAVVNAIRDDLMDPNRGVLLKEQGTMVVLNQEKVSEDFVFPLKLDNILKSHNGIIDLETLQKIFSASSAELNRRIGESNAEIVWNKYVVDLDMIANLYWNNIAIMRMKEIVQRPGSNLPFIPLEIFAKELGIDNIDVAREICKKLEERGVKIKVSNDNIELGEIDKAVIQSGIEYLKEKKEEYEGEVSKLSSKRDPTKSSVETLESKLTDIRNKYDGEKEEMDEKFAKERLLAGIVREYEEG